MKRILIILISILMLAGCNSKPQPPVPPGPTSAIVYRGFFVGVSDYIYFSGIDLKSPAMNTYRLKQLFEKARFSKDNIAFISITRLINHEATKKNILEGIAREFKEADDNDVSYFYFMGHGTNQFANYPSILPADYSTTFSSYLTVHELELALSQIKGTKMVVLETCHAGNLIQKSQTNFNQQVIKVFARDTKDYINKEGYQVLCSSSGEEYTWEQGQESFFMNALLQGCNSLNADVNKDGIVDMTELHKYIVSHVTIQTAQIYPEGSIFPVYEE